MKISTSRARGSSRNDTPAHGGVLADSEDLTDWELVEDRWNNTFVRRKRSDANSDDLAVLVVSAVDNPPVPHEQTLVEEKVTARQSSGA